MAKTKPIRKCLIANRGEIAVRIARGLREAGIRSVAIHSEPDRGSPHVSAADEAISIGGKSPGESYLDFGKLLDAARRSGADAVHPGYGFVSENADFAAAARDAGLVFIGPSPESIRLMGDKVEARVTAERLGVPTIPGSAGPCADAADARAVAESVGLPVVLKARGGGGGKGIRTVTELAEVESAFERARSEAAGAFGQADVYVEKLITGARHIEVQVLGDGAGGAIHLGERECSLQRRHQKLIEESPSPVVDAAQRARLGEAAVALTAGSSYANAGTVELLVEDDGSFYFLEMNARLQVEHPVTELVTGVDLVACQLAIAQTGVIPIAQSDVKMSGHAIEARIYAEDPFGGFVPSAGVIDALQLPSGPGVRVEHALRAGLEVSTFYDPMLAKLCVHAPTRDQAIARLRRAASEFVVSGLETTLPLVVRLCSEDDFRAGRFHTGWLEPFVSGLRERGGASAPVTGEGDDHVDRRARAAAVAAALVRFEGRGGEAAPRLEAAPPSPWVMLGRASSLR